MHLKVYLLVCLFAYLCNSKEINTVTRKRQVPSEIDENPENLNMAGLDVNKMPPVDEHRVGRTGVSIESVNRDGNSTVHFMNTIKIVSDSMEHTTSKMNFMRMIWSGRLNLTQLEKTALEKFRPLVRPLIIREDEKSDAYLIPWLRARKLNVESAVTMFRENQQWRKENKIDTIANEILLVWNPPPYSVEGYDHEGHPIHILSPTTIDIRGLMLQGLRSKLYRSVLQALEKCLEERHEVSKRLGKEITQIVYIIDFERFNLRQHACLPCIPFFTDYFFGLENYYPGIFKYLVLINLPRIALPLIEIVRPLLSESTSSALSIFPPDRMEWTKFLTTIISPDQLPYKFGGTKKKLIRRTQRLS